MDIDSGTPKAYWKQSSYLFCLSFHKPGGYYISVTWENSVSEILVWQSERRLW